MKRSSNLRKQRKILQIIKKYKARMSFMSDEELTDLTRQFKQRLAEGTTDLDKLLPEAYAAICEADKRVLGKFPYDVQILAAIAMHQGYLAEMNTGEGKTLTATMPLYLNALTGKSTMLVTANEYLALRDAEEMGEVYKFMGLTVAAGVRTVADEPFTNEEKKEVYASDIVYTTHGVLGFDYLLNNLVKRAEDRFLREFYYVIIDEADSALLDSAQTPLVISGSPRVQSNLYELADFFVTTLIKDRDYETEEKKVWLTREGIKYAEEFFQIENFYGEKYFEINRHVILALRAHVIFEKRKDYMIAHDGKMALLDNGSGRMLKGVKLRGGQHQALECKEKVTISQETRSVASITFQNLFLMFEKMAGMSGTLSDAADELMDIYKKKVLIIPPNRPLLRKDLKDLYFQFAEEQVDAALRNVLEIHKTGQPVLIVVSTITQTEVISRILLENEIAHNVLNANNAYWEAEIIKEAGKKNAVTVATSMAGRGTDIKLGEGVAKLGGLAVIGIGRMVNSRQERQARGRSGRQGDPGISRFYVCLQDDVIVNSGLDKIEKYLESDKYIGKHKLKRLINDAQNLGVEYNVLSRKQSLNYDCVLKKQSEMMYEVRNRLLDGGTLSEEKVLEIAEHNIDVFLKKEYKVDERKLNRYILDNLSYHLEENNAINLKNRKMVKNYLMHYAQNEINEQKEKIGNQKYIDEFMRRATLSAIDEAWVEQVDYLQQLRLAVSGRSIAQRNPLYEYQLEALESFEKMEETIFRNVARNILLSDVYIDEDEKLCILLP